MLGFLGPELQTKIKDMGRKVKDQANKLIDQAQNDLRKFGEDDAGIFNIIPKEERLKNEMIMAILARNYN